MERHESSDEWEVQKHHGPAWAGVQRPRPTGYPCRLKGQSEGKMQSLKQPVSPGSSGPMWLVVHGIAGAEVEGLSVSRTAGQPGLEVTLGFLKGRVGTLKGL